MKDVLKAIYEKNNHLLICSFLVVFGIIYSIAACLDRENGNDIIQFLLLVYALVLFASYCYISEKKFLKWNRKLKDISTGQTEIAVLIGIVCIIIGYMIPYKTQLRNFLFSFQMPLILILIGFNIKKVNSVPELLEQIKLDIRYLLVPYLIFYVTYSVLGIMLYEETVDITVWIDKLFWALESEYEEHSAIGVIWFLNLLFCSKTIFSVIQLMMPNHLKGVCCGIVAFAGYILSVQDMWLFMSLDIALIAVFYLYIGSILKRILDIYEKHHMLVIGSLGAWLILWNRGLYIEFAYRYYPCFPLLLIESLCGSMCIIILSKWIGKYLKLLWIDQRIEKYVALILGIYYLLSCFQQPSGNAVLYDCMYNSVFVLSLAAIVVFIKKLLRKSHALTERAFLTVLSIYIIRLFCNGTMFTLPWPHYFDIVLRIVAMLIVCIKLSDRTWENNKKGFLLIMTVMALIASCFSNGYIFLFDIAIFIVGAMDIPYEKILKEYCIYGIAILGITILGALTGCIKDLIYSGIRHSFGIVYPTDFAAHVVYLALAVWVVFRKIPAKIMAISMIAMSFFLYYYCRARCGTIVMGLSAIIVLLIERIELREISKKPYRKIVKIMDWLVIFWMPLCAAVMIDMSVKYSADEPTLNAINKLISSRLWLAHEAIMEYGIKFFGTAFDMTGGGGDIVTRSAYNFIDSSYCLILLQYGSVILITTCILYMWTVKRAINVGNRRLAMALALIAIHSMIEHHLLELAYNPFLLLAFGELIHTGGHYALKDGRFQKQKYLVGLLYGIISVLVVVLFPRFLSYARTIVTLLQLNQPSKNIFFILIVMSVLFIAIMAIKKSAIILVAYFYRQNPSGRVMVIWLLYIVAMVAMVMFFETVLQRRAHSFTETLERGTKIIQKLRENEEIDPTEIKICVDDIPELYERAEGKITNPILSGGSLASNSETIILTDIKKDLTLLTDNGYLFGELSNQEGIYVKSEKASKIIEEYGIKLQDHYSVRQSVDLDEMAKVNELEFGEGGLLIQGPDHSLGHGPWITVYKGRILVEYRIKLIESAITSGEVAKIRLSVEAGKYVLQEKSINREDFDENGFCVMTIEQRMDSKEWVEFLLLANEGTVLEIEEITYGKNGR